MSTEKAIAPLLPSTQSDIDQAQRSARLKYLTLFVLLFALASNTATSGEGWIGSFALTSVEGPVRQPALFAWALLGLFDAWSIVDIRVCDPLAAKTLTGNDLDDIGGIPGHDTPHFNIERCHFAVHQTSCWATLRFGKCLLGVCARATAIITAIAG